MFTFFLKGYRSGILTFCGSIVEVEPSDINGRESFRMFEDGVFKHVNPTSKHSNVVKAVITGKKSWGLWAKQWCEGINEYSFTQDEILNEFYSRNIDIPKPLLKEFDNRIDRDRIKRIERYDKAND